MRFWWKISHSVVLIRRLFATSGLGSHAGPPDVRAPGPPATHAFHPAPSIRPPHRNECKRCCRRLGLGTRGVRRPARLGTRICARAVYRGQAPALSQLARPARTLAGTPFAGLRRGRDGPCRVKPACMVGIGDFERYAKKGADAVLGPWFDRHNMADRGFQRGKVIGKTGV